MKNLITAKSIPNDLHPFAELVFSACLKGGEVAAAMQHKGLARKDKGGGDFATEADIASQIAVTKVLSAAQADITIIGEEDDAHEVSNSEFFVVDPIDGTFFYAAGADCWGVTAAYFKNGKPDLGIFILPARGIAVIAAKNKGCFYSKDCESFKQIQLSHDKPLKESIIGIVQGSRWNTPRQLRELNIPLIEASLCASMPGSAIDAAESMLSGVCASYINYAAKIWDFASFALAIEEAGGQVSKPNGDPHTWDTIPMQSVFSVNKALHSEVLEITKNFIE